jgi:predicted esterase YcpF (UPF0227 family)
MKLLYIYGWDSSPNSNTVQNLRTLLPNNTIVSVEYDQFNPVEAVKFFNKFIVDNQIGAVVASSFGAFIGIYIGHSIYKFLINPCLMASVEVSKLNEVSTDFIAQCQQLENSNKIVDDEDMRFTSAFFADQDELFSYKTKYLELGYYKLLDLNNEHHQLSYNGLQVVVKHIELVANRETKNL